MSRAELAVRQALPTRVPQPSLDVGSGQLMREMGMADVNRDSGLQSIDNVYRCGSCVVWVGGI